MDRKHLINLVYTVIAVVAILAIQSWWVTNQRVAEIPYSRFETLLENGQIAEATVKQDTIEGRLRQPIDGDKEFFTTTRIEPEIANRLQQHGVQKFTGAIESNWLQNILSWVIPLAVFIGIWLFLIRRMAQRQGFGGMMNIGKSKAKIYVEADTEVSFDDVAGVDEAKAELQEVVDFLKDPASYGRLGARVPKGVLLVGPPGTGKTLLARAVAGEAGVTFFSISGSEFVEMFVGVGAARVRDLFEQAGKQKPCIIFVDELDALGRARGLGQMGGGHDEKEQTLNQLLAELDGFDPSEGIVLLAATNRPEILDPALLRAGRFDRQVLVDRPEKLGRQQILKVHIRKIRHLADDVEIEQIAAMTPGFTGADLANLANEAALLATRRGADAVSMDDFNNAIERIIAGLEKRSRVMNSHEREVIAHHEMGHALVAATVPGSDPVHKISIIPRGVSALGYTIQRPTEDRFLMTQEELEGRMTTLLGGRAAERLIFDEVTTGAADDLDKATDIARHMVMQYGMSSELGLAVYARRRQSYLAESGYVNEPREYSEATAREIDQAVSALVDRAFGRATEILERRRKDLEEGARLLLEKETLTADDFAPLKPKGKEAEAAE